MIGVNGRPHTPGQTVKTGLSPSVTDHRTACVTDVDLAAAAWPTIRIESPRRLPFMPRAWEAFITAPGRFGRAYMPKSAPQRNAPVPAPSDVLSLLQPTARSSLSISWAELDCVGCPGHKFPRS